MDKRNRPEGGKFRCLFCGRTKHADLNAPSNVSRRRALADGALWINKASVLAHEVAAFMADYPVMRKRHAGQRGLPADPRWSNPYFAKVLPARGGHPPAVGAQRGATTSPCGCVSKPDSAQGSAIEAPFVAMLSHSSASRRKARGDAPSTPIRSSP